MKKYFFKYIALLIFLITLSAFNFRDVMVGSWNPQYIYNTNGQSIRDMTFSDSLTGFIVTWGTSLSGVRIIKTTNGGNNWFTSLSFDTAFLYKVQAINKDSIIVCEGNSILKTTNKGVNWTRLFYPGYPYNSIMGFSMYVLNFDTIWVGGQTGFNDPHLYLTTNGGLNWIKKFELPSGSQFDIVYFFNKRIGFCSYNWGIYKTTNGGDNWFKISTESNTTRKIQFVDSLIGWKCDNSWNIKKTTNGGYNWTLQSLPVGGQIFNSTITDFCVINKDTLWGCGGNLKCPNLYNLRGILWKTTNGGTNWGYQLPDTNIIKYPGWSLIKFINSKIGWTYISDSVSGIGLQGIHTTTGGNDTIFYVGIKEQNNYISVDYELYQNYPNPFNPTTSIRYKVENTKQIKLVVFNILGKEITTLVNENKKAGEYEVKFDGTGLSSGVYYYVLYADGVMVDTRKMVLIK